MESKLKVKNCNLPWTVVSTLLGPVSISQKKERRGGGEGGGGGVSEGGKGIGEY